LYLQINKIHFPVKTLGFGNRVGIWLQGCSIRCPGCINRDTWDPKGGGRISVSDLIGKIGFQILKSDGITISGGEPLDQSDALRDFLLQTKHLISGDILLYTGCSKQCVDSQHSWVLDVVDVLISEPFDEKSGQTKFLRGSDNQRIHLLSEKSRQRYPKGIDTKKWDDNRSLQMIQFGDEVFFAGIPRIGDMDVLKRLLVINGLSLKTSEKSNV
jgi:anaerobic ribonucleoside-triphosphate reductase activating protein